MFLLLVVQTHCQGQNNHVLSFDLRNFNNISIINDCVIVWKKHVLWINFVIQKVILKIAKNITAHTSEV